MNYHQVSLNITLNNNFFNFLLLVSVIVLLCILTFLAIFALGVYHDTKKMKQRKKDEHQDTSVFLDRTQMKI